MSAILQILKKNRRKRFLKVFLYRYNKWKLILEELDFLLIL